MTACWTCGYKSLIASTCAGCHQDDYTGTTNPDHVAIGIPNDCASCHTTEPEWSPASFDIHDQYYTLNGAHAAISANCAECHNGDYNNTPSTCYGCHQAEYEATTNPDHAVIQFPTDCIQCHSESAWLPSTFDHDNLYFPIYSGRHEGEWVTCSDCHNVPTDYSVFDCLGCHINPETDERHEDVPGYNYNSISCFECHPQGEN